MASLSGGELPDTADATGACDVPAAGVSQVPSENPAARPDLQPRLRSRDDSPWRIDNQHGTGYVRSAMMETARQLIGRRIREERIRAGYTNQAEFAELIGIGADRLSRIETGKRGVDSVLLQEVADRLDVRMEELLRDPSPQVVLALQGDADGAAMSGMVRWADSLLEDIETMARFVGRKPLVG